MSFKEGGFLSRSAQKKLNKSLNIKNPNFYVQALYKEYKSWAFDEQSAPLLKGKWREHFSKNQKTALHLEIGPGNGKHFANLCLQQKTASCLAIELKYKPLIQTIRRTRKNNCSNGKVIRFNASLIDSLFEKGELNQVYIHFPDPWLKKRRTKKHQLLQKGFCDKVYKLQGPDSFLELKTDSKDYFHQSVNLFKQAGYNLKEYSVDLHKNKEKEKNFIESLSQFELLFFQKNIPIKRALFYKRL